MSLARAFMAASVPSVVGTIARVEDDAAERLLVQFHRAYTKGLDPAAAGHYERVRNLADRLAYAGNEAARRYLDGELDAKSAADWLAEHAMMPRARAEQRVRFFDQYRAYVINYTIGKDLVGRYVEARGGTPDRPEKRWEVLKDLLSSPRLPGKFAMEVVAETIGRGGAGKG